MKSFSGKKLVRRGCAFGALVEMFSVTCVAADPSVLDQRQLILNTNLVKGS